MDLNIEVNSEDWALDVAPADVLLDVLRERIGIKSPKIGCERGDCGDPEYVTCTDVQNDCTVGPTLFIQEAIPTDATSFGQIKSLYN